MNHPLADWKHDLRERNEDDRLLLVAHVAFAVERQYAVAAVEGAEHPLAGRRLSLQ